MTKRYIIKAIPTSNFKPAINGNKVSFLGGETVNIVCGEDKFGSPQISFESKDEQSQLEDLMQKPRGFLNPTAGFWSDVREPSKINGEMTDPFIYRHVVNRDSKGDDEGVILEARLHDEDGNPDPDGIMNTLLIKMLKYAPGVAWNGEIKYAAGLSITSLEDMVVKKVENKKVRNKAAAKLEELSITDQRKYYSVIFGRDHSILNDNSVYDKLSDFIDESAAKAETFIALLDDSTVTEKYKYTILYNKDIIIKDSTGYFYQGYRLGFTLDEVYKFLQEKKNQELKFAIEKEFKAFDK